MRKTYQITEYGSFISGKQVDGYSTLPEKTFEQLVAIECFYRSIFLEHHQRRWLHDLIGCEPFPAAHTLPAPTDFFILIRRS